MNKKQYHYIKTNQTAPEEVRYIFERGMRMLREVHARRKTPYVYESNEKKLIS